MGDCSTRLACETCRKRKTGDWVMTLERRKVPLLRLARWVILGRIVSLCTSHLEFQQPPSKQKATPCYDCVTGCMSKASART